MIYAEIHRLMKKQEPTIVFDQERASFFQTFLVRAWYAKRT
jgi:hypothetical protein